MGFTCCKQPAGRLSAFAIAAADQAQCNAPSCRHRDVAQDTSHPHPHHFFFHARLLVLRSGGQASSNRSASVGVHNARAAEAEEVCASAAPPLTAPTLLCRVPAALPWGQSAQPPSLVELRPSCQAGISQEVEQGEGGGFVGLWRALACELRCVWT